MARILICIPLPPLPHHPLAVLATCHPPGLVFCRARESSYFLQRGGIKKTRGKSGLVARGARKGRGGANGWKYHSRTRRTKLPICLGRSFLFSDSAELLAWVRAKLHPSSFILLRFFSTPAVSPHLPGTGHPSSKAPA